MRQCDMVRRMQSDEELLTAPQVSHELGVSISTVRRRAESGALPYVQKLPGPNGAFVFRRGDVRTFKRQQAEASAQEQEPEQPATATS